MAKIYETHSDFEKDKLKDQVKDLRAESAEQMSLGGMAIIAGQLVDKANSKGGWGLGMASIALHAVGIVEVVKSFFSMNKAHNLRLQKERLGPEAVIFPPETVGMPNAMPVHSAAVDVSENKHQCKCKHAEQVQPKTLLEQASRPEAGLERK